MLRSLFSGVSGLKSHQTRMDVIGNNIANVNTTAYKSMQLNFSDVMYQTTQSATGPNPETKRAGMNPKQIGLGVQTAAITTKIAEEGATQTTGNPFDLKIAGDEFFIVSNGTNTFFTRDGSFYVDAAGNLAMSASGYNVMGWQYDEETGNIKKDTVTPIKVMDESSSTYPAEWTSQAICSGVVDWFDENQSEKAGKTLNLQIYDKLGYSYTVKMSLHNGMKPNKDAANPANNIDNYSYYVQVDDVLDSSGNTILDTAEKKAAVKFGTSGNVKVEENFGLNSGDIGHTATGEDYVTFDYEDPASGATLTVSVLLYDDAGAGLFEPTATPASSDSIRLKTGNVTVNDPSGTVTSIDPKELFAMLYGTAISPDAIQAASFNKQTGSLIVKEKNLAQGSVLNYSGKNGEFLNATGGDAAESTTLDLTAVSDAFTKITIDFTKTLVSDNKGRSTIAAEKGDIKGLGSGRALGKIQGVAIGTDGIIRASYSNNQTRILGQIAVAQFANPSGLQKEGENLYTSTTNSGEFDGIGIDISSAGDKMNTGVLEMSNVDLSSEFTDMITTQRGYQANSRIITVSDTLLEELVNLKR